VATRGLRHASHSRHPIRNYKRPKLVHESVHAEVIVFDSTEGAFSAGPLAYTPLVLAGLSVHDGAEGAFDAGSLTRISNSSP
jgi:hypothetical protein